MFKNWEDITVSEIVVAMWVLPETGKTIHNNRPTHGFILNDSDGQKDYYFSDGTVLKTYENEFFYLPKGSYYKVETVKKGGCYAINFDADISGKPFSMSFRDNEKILKVFKDSEKAWREKTPFYQATIKKAVYEIILMIVKEQQKKYVPSEKEKIIMPALEKIKSDFTKNELSVSELSKICGISEVYFRRIFMDKFGISPKEYIIKMRISYAKDLLKSGQFSVSEVAKICGYAEQCHFSREFTKRTGENPSDLV